MYINKAIIYGNLTRDPELRSMPTGGRVATLAIATNRVWKDKNGAKQESVDYHNVVIFGPQAEVAERFLKKGSAVFIEGRMQTRSWDAPDGTKKYRHEIVTERLQLGPKREGGGSYAPKQADDGGYGDMDMGQAAPTNSSNSGAVAGGSRPIDTIEYPEDVINTDDIPF